MPNEGDVLSTVEPAETSSEVSEAPSETSEAVEAVQVDDASLVYADMIHSVDLLTCLGVYLVLGVLVVRFFFERVRP